MKTLVFVILASLASGSALASAAKQTVQSADCTISIQGGRAYTLLPVGDSNTNFVLGIRPESARIDGKDDSAPLFVSAKIVAPSGSTNNSDSSYVSFSFEVKGTALTSGRNDGLAVEAALVGGPQIRQAYAFSRIAGTQYALSCRVVLTPLP